MGYTKKAKKIAADQKYGRETYMCSHCNVHFASKMEHMEHMKKHHHHMSDYHSLPGLGLFR